MSLSLHSRIFLISSTARPRLVAWNPVVLNDSIILSIISLSEDTFEKSTPRHLGVESGNDELSPRTADAETDGMCGFALTVLVESNGVAANKLIDLESGASSPSLVPTDGAVPSAADDMILVLCQNGC